MVEIKNHKMLLQAWQKMGDGFHKKNHLVLVGEGPLRDDVQDFIHSHFLEKTVSLVSWQKDLVPYYKSFDELILPSINEGTPVAIIEAMASGILTVASAVGGVPDLMGKVLTKYPHEVCLCERGVMIAPTLESLGAVFHGMDQEGFLGTAQITAAKEFSRQFSVERLISDMTGLYESLLK
jgi:glycosyltransferase involved in cell wall biosynthesis